MENLEEARLWQLKVDAKLKTRKKDWGFLERYAVLYPETNPCSTKDMTANDIVGHVPMFLQTHYTDQYHILECRIGCSPRHDRNPQPPEVPKLTSLACGGDRATPSFCYTTEQPKANRRKHFLTRIYCRLWILCYSLLYYTVIWHNILEVYIYMCVYIYILKHNLIFMLLAEPSKGRVYVRDEDSLESLSLGQMLLRATSNNR